MIRSASAPATRSAPVSLESARRVRDRWRIVLASDSETIVVALGSKQFLSWPTVQAQAFVQHRLWPAGYDYASWRRAIADAVKRRGAGR